MKDLVARIIEDKTVDANEVAELKEKVYADGTIDVEEVKALFAVNNACSGNPDNCPEWKDFFVSAILDYLLEDDVIDEEECDLLVAEIGADGDVDEVEKALLLQIEEKAMVIEGSNLEALIQSVK